MLFNHSRIRKTIFILMSYKYRATILTLIFTHALTEQCRSCAMYRRYSIKEGVLKISQNSQEKTSTYRIPPGDYFEQWFFHCSKSDEH